MSEQPRKINFFNILLTLLYIVSFTFFFYFLIKGLPYFQLPVADRPFSPLHNLYKPGGVVGHGLGILGTGMMLLMLLYSVRKRVAIFGNIGSIKDWLNFHIYLGIMGPLFVLLHTSFKFGGIVSVSFWSMTAVAISGFVGRYLYIKIPQEIKGLKEKVNQHSDFIESQNQKWHTDVAKQELSLSEDLLEKVESKYGQIETEDRAKEIKASENMGMFFLQIIFQDIYNFFYIRRVTKNFSHKHHLARAEFEEIRNALTKKTKLINQIKFLKQLEHLFHYWHVIHRPFAYIMLTILFVHVAIALLLGYVWIF